MAEYHLLTVWRFDAPLNKVYAAIQNSLSWPEWWPGACKVEQTAAGDVNGINSILRYFWRGKLPYKVVFEVRTSHVENLVAIEGSAQGDLEGVGCWHFFSEGEVSVVRFEWHVHSTLWWMNLIAPIARTVFIRNHMIIMEQGGEALARLLNGRLLSCESVNLMTAPTHFANHRNE